MTISLETVQEAQVVANGTLFERYQSRQPLLYGWVKQVQRAINLGETDSRFWEVVGHSLIVVDPDKDGLQSFLMATAGELGGQYLRLTADQFLECADTLIDETMPSVVFLEQGPWLFRNEDMRELVALRIRLRGVLESFYAKTSPVVVVTHTTRFGSISERLLYRHGFDRHIFWADPRPELIAQDLFELVGEQHLDRGLTENPERLGRVLSLEFPSSRRVGMLATALRRRATLDSRRVGWRDLIEICVNGTGEGFQSNEHLKLERIATHEAGHAVVNITGSDFRSVPDMVTVVPGNGTAGVAVESYHHNYEKRGGNLTFSEVCHRIRVSLAGRAAEELEYGIEGCSAYASQNDLENASSMAVHLIMQNGFPSDYEQSEAAGSNLFSVPDGSELGETKYYDVQLRCFLEKLYEQTKALLKENRPLFELVRRELLKERYLMREDLEHILARCKQDSLIY